MKNVLCQINSQLYNIFYKFSFTDVMFYQDAERFNFYHFYEFVFQSILFQRYQGSALYTLIKVIKKLLKF